VSERLPELLDAKHLAAELGITRAAAEAIIRQLPVVQVPGLRKVYVRRPDVEKLLEACTFSKDEVPAREGREREEKLSTTPHTHPAGGVV
jgi:hypothetical protein